MCEVRRARRINSVLIREKGRVYMFAVILAWHAQNVCV